jgi:thioredoxin reductase (NADPH)
MTVIHQTAIVGAGPAGYTAAIYAARAGLEPLVFESSVARGGALMSTTDVENYPGFAEGIQGPELMETLRKQADRFGAQLLPIDVTRLELSPGTMEVHADGERHLTRSVILAMGSRYRSLGLPDEARLLGHGVSSCATCDGFFFRGQDVMVVGGGDSAMEEALFLSRFARTVTVVHRRNELRASRIMQERARSEPKISFLWNANVHELLGGDRLTGVVVQDLVSQELREIPIDGLFVAIGHDPRSELVARQVDLDSAGYVLTQTRSSYTNVPGVFACGDLVDHTYRQAVTAAGSGCVAALDAERWLAATAGRPGSDK